MSFRVLGTGSSLPRRVVTNDELSAFLDTSDEWIRQRVGVAARHVCTDESTTDLACAAALAALADAGVTPAELDLILCATISPEDIVPGAACAVQGRLGADCPAMDISAACSGFLFTLDAAAGYFARKKVKKALVIGAERMSGLLDWTDRSTCVIFGDGAGAVVLGEGEGYLASRLNNRGGSQVIRIPREAGNSPFYQGERLRSVVYMNGRETFKFAVNSLCADLRAVLDEAGAAPEDISWVVAHQANVRILQAAMERLPIPPERFFVNIEHCGNTSAASVPLALDELNRSGGLKPGDLVALCAFGGGLSSAACLLRW